MKAWLDLASDWAVRTRQFTRRHSRVLMTLAGLVFGVAILLSIFALELDWRDLNSKYFAVLVLLLAPIGVALGALNMIVLARSSDVRMSLRDALHYSVFAQISEILPVPGGAIIRGGMLVERGARVGKATTLVLSNAVLSVACAAVGAGLCLGLATFPGAILGVSGGILLFGSMAPLARHAGMQLAFAALGLRIIGLLLVGLRLAVAFLVLGTTVSFTDALPFAFAMILGSASSLAPGGLGISEALAAGMAMLSTVAPAAAILAVALDRVVSFAVSGAAFAATQYAAGNRAPSPN